MFTNRFTPHEPKNQNDIMNKDSVDAPRVETPRTEIFKVPGVETLHTKPVEEIGNVIANVLRSRSNIKSITYEIGKHFELTYNGD